MSATLDNYTKAIFLGSEGGGGHNAAREALDFTLLIHLSQKVKEHLPNFGMRMCQI